MANSDCILLMGGNMAEAHPVGFQWVTEAKLRGATVMHIDPRFTRTSAVADRHVPIRAGSDIVLLGGLINHMISNELYFRDYVLAYTNAATIINPEYQDTEDLDGLFSGYNPETGQYDTKTWSYATSEDLPETPEQQRKVGLLRDETLTDPNCVFQILKRHFARYTPEMVERLCGIKPAEFAWIAETIAANSGRERTTTIGYATGWTQHTLGVQIIRTAAVLQLLLGNVGRPGGGIMALRGHASIQGSTDIPTLFNLLPGYLPMPIAGRHDTFADWVEAIGSKQQKGFWANSETYAVNLLKAWFGEAATAENDWVYDYLPKLTGAHGTYQTTVAMLNDEVEGYFVLGQNPAVGSANGRQQRMAMSHLKWLVVRDLNMIESATWWKEGPEIESGELKTTEIGTEIFYLPAATHVEKAGSFTQTQRMLQWRHQAVRPPGQAESELDFFHELGVRIRAKLAGSTDPRDRPLLDLTWDYPADAHGNPDPEAVLSEINGKFLTGEKAGQHLTNYVEMQPDGSTSGGCWIYTGVYTGGENQAARRVPNGGDTPAQREWGWVWPADRRILYNRASADPEGKPWSERKRYIWWDEQTQRWVGHDNPDFVVERAPGAKGDLDKGGPAALDGDDAFIMQADGKGWLYVPSGLVDGPLPAHYEPQESPVVNSLYNQQQAPARVTFARTDNLGAPSAGDYGVGVYPHVFTTYRLTEHHTAGGMSRWSPYLAELQPEMFCEVSPELAAEIGLENAGWATIISPRSAIEARVLVTDRMQPLTINGRQVHQVGLPYHWGVGTDAIVSGDATNDLLGVALDPNAQIQESKVASCAVVPGRRPRGAALEELVESYRQQARVSVDTDNSRHGDEDDVGRPDGTQRPMPEVEGGTQG